MTRSLSQARQTRNPVQGHGGLMPADRPGSSWRIVADLRCELVGVLDQQFAERRVMGEGLRSPEVVPGVPAAVEPGLLDLLRLLGFDGSWCEERFALGDAGPDECGCFLAFAVAEGGLDGAWDGWQAFGDGVPGVLVEASVP